MSGPQCEDGYTRIANELLDALCRIRIPGESMQVFLVIVRKTYGYGKKEDQIALSQFMEATGIKKKPNIVRALKQLSELKVIVIKKGNAGNTTYRINKLYLEWEPLSKKITLSKKIIEPLSKKIPTKEKVFKERSKERLEPCEAWHNYLAMRVKIRKPMTDKAKEMAGAKLLAMWKAGHDPIAVLNQSTFNSWQGLFPVKGAGPTTDPEPRKEVSPKEAELAERRRRILNDGR